MAYDPNQERASDGRFGTVAGDHNGKQEKPAANSGRIPVEDRTKAKPRGKGAPKPTAEQVASLTPDERKIVDILGTPGKKLSDKAILAKAGMSQGQVRDLIASAKQKLGLDPNDLTHNIRAVARSLPKSEGGSPDDDPEVKAALGRVEQARAKVAAAREKLRKIREREPRNKDEDRVAEAMRNDPELTAASAAESLGLREEDVIRYAGRINARSSEARAGTARKNIDNLPEFRSKLDPTFKTPDTEKTGKDESGGWKPERVELHDAYADATMRGVPTSEEPTVYMTGGGPASGKTTALLNNPDARVPKQGTAAHINPDDAKATLPEYRQGVEAGDQAAAGATHEESSHMTKVATQRALESGHDVVLDTVGDSGIKKLTEKVEAMRAQGAKKIVARYVTIDVDTAAQRALARGESEGRVVNEKYLRDAHADVSRTVQAAIETGLFDDLSVYDNDVPRGEKPHKIATYTKAGGLKVLDSGRWDAFKARGSAAPWSDPSKKTDAAEVDNVPPNEYDAGEGKEKEMKLSLTEILVLVVKGAPLPPEATPEEVETYNEMAAWQEANANVEKLLAIPSEL